MRPTGRETFVRVIRPRFSRYNVLLFAWSYGFDCNVRCFCRFVVVARPGVSGDLAFYFRLNARAFSSYDFSATVRT